MCKTTPPKILGAIICPQLKTNHDKAYSSSCEFLALPHP
jgi:hypothetical protein